MHPPPNTGFKISSVARAPTGKTGLEPTWPPSFCARRPGACTGSRTRVAVRLGHVVLRGPLPGLVLLTCAAAPPYLAAFSHARRTSWHWYSRALPHCGATQACRSSGPAPRSFGPSRSAASRPLLDLGPLAHPTSLLLALNLLVKMLVLLQLHLQVPRFVEVEDAVIAPCPPCPHVVLSNFRNANRCETR